VKNRWQRLLLSLVALAIALSVVNSSTHALTPSKGTTNQLGQGDARASDTFKLLLVADQNGANVTTQVDQFNTALQLVSDGNRLIKSGQDQEGQLELGEADQIFGTISHDAVNLRNEAVARNQQHTLLTYGSAVVVIVATTILAFLMLRLYNIFARRRILDLQFEVKGI
jgi:hypothetical protein